MSKGGLEVPCEKHALPDYDRFRGPWVIKWVVWLVKDDLVIRVGCHNGHASQTNCTRDYLLFTVCWVWKMKSV